MAELLGTTVEGLLSASRENSKRIYFVNEYCSALHLDIDGKLISIKDSAWVDIESDDITVKISGDFELNKEIEELSNDAEKLNDKIILKFGKWAVNQIMELILQSICTYKMSNIKDGETVTIKYDAFSLGDKALIYQDFMISYPKIERDGNAELLSAYAKNEREIIKAYKKLGWQSDIGFDFMLMLLAYPIRALYFKHLCKPHILKKNILNADKHKAIDEKRTKKKKHGFLKAIGIIFVIVFLFFFVNPYLNVEHDKPALISADYSTITMFEQEYEKVDKLPFDANEVLTLGAETWYDVRTDGLSRLDWLGQDDKVKMYEDGKGYIYLCVENYTETIFTDEGDKDYNDFETHIIYKSKSSTD